MRGLAVIALLAACGSSHSGMPDGNGSGSDGTVDADIDADPNVRGTVVVHVVDKNGAPLAGMHVVFIDTDQTVTHIMTDAAGAAQASVFPNANVTVIRARDGGGSYSLTTVQALNPGDDIKLISADSATSTTEDPFSQRVVPMPSTNLVSATKTGSSATYTTAAPHGLATGDTVVVEGMNIAAFNGTWQVASAPSTTTFTVAASVSGTATAGTAAKAVPFTVTYPSYATAQSYTVYTPCGPMDVASTTAALALKTGCVGAAMDLVVVARASNNAILAYAQKTAIAVTANGTTAVTDTWHPLDTITASYTNPTTRVTDITADRFVPYVRTPSVATGNTTANSATATVTLTAPSPATATMKTRLRCPLGSSPDCITSSIGSATQTITQQVDGTLATYSLDVGANLLPWVSAVYQPTTTTLEMTLTGTGAIDLYEANLRYTGATATPRGQVIYTWRVFGPTPGNFTFPALPADVPGDPTVRTTDVQSSYQVFLCETDAVSGYRNAIKNPYETLATCEMSSSLVTKPMTATLSRLSQWN